MNFVRVIINLFQFNRTNWKAALLCLLAAAIFWIFNAFNKSQSTTIRFPVHFDYDQVHYVPVNPLPRHLNINVTGSGWELARKSFGFKLPELVIPLERPLEIKKIPTIAIKNMLGTQLGGLQINFIATDTLHVPMDERLTKTFHLGVDVSGIKFRKGYGSFKEVDIVPDTVVIDGPRRVVKAIPQPITLTINADNVSKSFRDEVEIPMFESETINRNPPVVTVHIPVSELVLIETRLKLSVIHLPRKLKAPADSVNTIIQIPTELRDDFKSKRNEISAIIDWKKVTGETVLYYPEVIGLPDYARVISIDTLTNKID